MYEYIRGNLVKVVKDTVVIEVAGIGYKIFIPTSNSGLLPALSTVCTIFISFQVRELSQTLYGFLSENERDLFEALLTITGIGPKLALSIVSNLSLLDLQQAVLEKNLDMLCHVPGIGKKTAERILIELKDKISLSFEPSSPAYGKSPYVNDATRALVHLGYSQLVAQNAVKKAVDTAPELIDLASLITLSLKNV